MTIHVFSNHPLISNTIIEICKRVNTNIIQARCEKFVKNPSAINPLDLIVLVESKTSPITPETIAKLRQKSKKIVLVKNPYSKLNVRHLYLKGSRNIITIEDSQSVFEQALVAAEENKPFLSSSVLSEIGITESSQNKKLSPDEITIIKMSWAEKRNKEIAESLCLSIRTIENKRIRIKEKFAVESFTGVFKKAIVDGLITI